MAALMDAPADTVDRDYEIVNGERVEQPPMGKYSNRVALRLFSLLVEFLEANPIGWPCHEDFFLLDAVNKTRRRPDVAFFTIDKCGLDDPLEMEGDWEFAPDLAVEVQSPFDRVSDMFVKVEEYFEYGVKQVWLVLPPVRKIMVYDDATTVRIHKESDMVTSPLLPGFFFTAASIFPRSKS